MDDCVSEQETVVVVTILFFAKARELAGVNKSQLTVIKNIYSYDLKEKIILKFGLESIKDNFVLAVEEEFVEDNVILNLADNNTVAVIPPLSGG